ncbi:F0F1 ATP synthase subunit B [Candidatus Gottesmanbacteria bacterium]|nr:F0F1 ATP synthase subunit B [Candidatus Gottesmanbacteria bacterium]
MEQLGIKADQLLSQIINFTIMMWLLGKFLYKPILKMLEERKKKIEEGLKYSEQAKTELEKIDKKRQEIINSANNEVKKIIEEGKKAGKETEAEIIKRAYKEAENIIKKGRQELELEGLETEKELKKQTVEIAATMTEKILQDIITIDDHRAFIDKKLKQLTQSIR